MEDTGREPSLSTGASNLSLAPSLSGAHAEARRLEWEAERQRLLGLIEQVQYDGAEWPVVQQIIAGLKSGLIRREEVPFELGASVDLRYFDEVVPLETFAEALQQVAAAMAVTAEEVAQAFTEFARLLLESQQWRTLADFIN